MTSSSPSTRRGTGTGTLLTDVIGDVAVVTFNNPGRRNALSGEIRAALPGVLEALQADSAVRVVVLTGAGGKAFISGADISESAERRTTSAARAEYDESWAALNRAWSSLHKPVIAMIRGFCLGAGLLIALQADIRIASADSQFGIPAARLGLAPGFAGVDTLVNLIGPAWASEVLFTGRRFPAAEALRMGLVNRVVPAADLLDEAMALARGIGRNAPLTLAACKAASARRASPRTGVTWPGSRR